MDGATGKSERDRERGVLEGVCLCVAADMEEAMEVERWGEEEEVAMDIDVSQEDIAEMKLVRSSLSATSQFHMESFGIPADYANDYSVSYLFRSLPSSSCIVLPATISSPLLLPAIQDKLYLVLDTNVLLSHLNFLEELKDYAIKGVTLVCGCQGVGRGWDLVLCVEVLLSLWWC